MQKNKEYETYSFRHSTSFPNRVCRHRQKVSYCSSAICVTDNLEIKSPKKLLGRYIISILSGIFSGKNFEYF